MFEGSYVALVTPFYPDGSINFERLKQLCQWHVENGTDGLVVLGTTGESSTTDAAEDAAIVRCCVDAIGGRIPVIAGGGSNCTETSLAKSRKFRDLGADGLLLITPYYNKANQKGMYRHFATVAEAVDLPILLYNVPGRTGCSLSVECVEALSKLPNVRGIKEASGNISYTAKVARLTNDEFVLLSGNDDMIVPVLSWAAWASSASGPTSARSRCTTSWPPTARATAGARWNCSLSYLELINALFIEVNPIPVKEAMNMLGMEAGPCRLPLCEMEDKNREALQKALRVLEEA